MRKTGRTDGIIAKEQEKIIKEFKKTLKKKNKVLRVVTGVVRLSLISALGLGTFREISFQRAVSKGNYKTQKQIRSDAKLLNADLRVAEYYFNNFSKNINIIKTLKHNNGKPISVLIKDNYSPEQVKIIRDNLDILNKLFKDINSNYKFKVVDDISVMQSYLTGHTTIVFDNSLNNNDYNGSSKATIKVSYAGFVKDYLSSIKTNPSIEITNEHFSYVILHELLHSFGLGDIYLGTKAIHENTIMKIGEYNIDLNKIYPTDYGVLLSMYHNILGEDGKVDADKLKNATKLYEDYNQEFYTHFLKTYKDKGRVSEETNITDDVLFNNVFSSEFAGEVKSYDKGKTFEPVHRELMFLNETEYRLSIIKSNKEVYSYRGNYDRIDNMIVMHDSGFGRMEFDAVANREVGLESISPMVLVKDNRGYKVLVTDTYRPLYMQAKALNKQSVLRAADYEKGSKISQNIIDMINKKNEDIFFRNDKFSIIIPKREEECEDENKQNTDMIR